MARIFTRFSFSLSIVGLLVTPLVSQQASVASIVEQFYPASLTAYPDEIGGRKQCFAIYDADASGAPRTIVAAYTNHTDAVVRVLRASAGAFDVVAEPQGLDLFGMWCDVALEDVDADGRKEIRVNFSATTHTVSWIFRWDGQQLWNLTPTAGTTTSGDVKTRFVDGDLVDVDNDGTKEIYVAPQDASRPDEPRLPGMLYRLRGQRYVEDKPLVGMWKFVRNTSAPEPSSVSLIVPPGARGPYTLRVVNGRPDGTARVTTAQVWINRQEILPPTTLDPKTPIVERVIALQRDNELSVRIGGQPSSEILIIIDSERWGPS